MLKGCEESRGRCGENKGRTSEVGGEERRRRIKRKVEDIWRCHVAVDIQTTNGCVPLRRNAKLETRCAGYCYYTTLVSKFSPDMFTGSRFSSLFVNGHYACTNLRP